MRTWQPIAYLYSFIFIAILLILWRTDGHFTYGLDDAYIHLALAKHFVEHGMWGVTPYEPSACSSSILWPLLLSGSMYLVGAEPLISLVLSLVIATGFVVWLGRCIRGEVADAGAARSLTLFAGWVSCIAALVFIGMEHVLQVWICLAFAWRAARILAMPAPTFTNAWPLIVLAPVMTATRYEGLGLVAVVCVLLTLRQGWRNFFGRGLAVGCAVCASALAPVIAFGIVMHTMDLPFLPYSVQLKAWAPHVALRGLWLHFGPKFIINVVSHPELSFLLCAALYTLRAGRLAGAPFWKVPTLLQVIFVVACLLHLEFAITGAYTRYIAYLTVLGVVSLGLESGPLFQAGFRRYSREAGLSRGRRFLAGGTWVTLMLMTAFCHLAVPQMARNIYQQQVQMARFLGTYYNGQAVALNDIGTSSFGTEIRMVDVFGLASAEVAEARLHGDYGKVEVDRMTRDKEVQVAIIYENWFDTPSGSILPDHWERVGTWKIPFNITCGWHTVSIFAVDPAAREGLIQHLVEFSATLPDAVEEGGLYMERSNGA